MESPLHESLTIQFPAVGRATSDARAAAEAIEEVFDELGPGNEFVFLFVGDGYDLDEIEQAIPEHYVDSVVGCTTSGVIGHNGFSDGGMSALGLRSTDFSVETFLIDNLHDSGRALQNIQASVDRTLDELRDGESVFGVLLIDGLAHAEERITASLFHALGDVPVIGGSAGDHLRFASTKVFFEGQFRDESAVVAIVRTTVPISIFCHQHHVPSDTVLVVTSADPDSRVIYTINGMPAAEAYAEAVNVPVDRLTEDPELFASHPLLLRAGPRSFIRSVRSVGPDSSLEFFCAIDEGVVLRIGKPTERIDSLQNALQRADQQVGGAQAILAFDCVLRRAEFARAGLEDAAGKVFENAKTVGFSTYGEQVDALHVNQTLVGVAIGDR